MENGRVIEEGAHETVMEIAELVENVDATGSDR